MRLALEPSASAWASMGGYISVNSCVSPSIAAMRLSAVELTASRAPRWPSACILSASAVVRKSFAMFGKPSFSAFFAKALYFWYAWLSPAKAFLRLSVVSGIKTLLSMFSGRYFISLNGKQEGRRNFQIQAFLLEVLLDYHHLLLNPGL